MSLPCRGTNGQLGMCLGFETLRASTFWGANARHVSQGCSVSVAGTTSVPASVLLSSLVKQGQQTQNERLPSRLQAGRGARDINWGYNRGQAPPNATKPGKAQSPEAVGPDRDLTAGGKMRSKDIYHKGKGQETLRD